RARDESAVLEQLRSKLAFCDARNHRDRTDEHPSVVLSCCARAVSDFGDNLSECLIEQNIKNPGEIPIHSGAAIEVVDGSIGFNRARIEQVVAVQSSAKTAGEMGDAGSVIDVGSAPLGQQSGQGSRVVSVGGGAADQNVPAASGSTGRGARATNQKVPALSPNEPIGSRAADQDIVDNAAGVIR